MNALPKKYEYSHWLSLRLHDYIVRTVKTAEEDRIFDVNFQLANANQADEFGELEKGEQVWLWLEENGYQHILENMIRQQAMAALMSDLCNFTFEALNCSRKGKLTVAFALLRKPFKDNLFYLEWMLADANDFTNTFKAAGPVELDRIATRGEGNARRAEIVKQAVERTMNLTRLTADVIQSIRYDRASDDGFAGLYDKANHLVTTHRAIRTEECNFNFLFSDHDALLTQWHLIYTKLPLILNHAVEVVNALMDGFADRNPNDYDTIQFERTVGMRLWSEGLEKGFETTQGLDLLKIVRKLNRKQCLGCKSKGTIAKQDEDLRYLYQTGEFRCATCGIKGYISLDSYRARWIRGRG